MNNTEIQQQSVKLKAQFKIEYEELVHKHIMEELEFMKAAKIKCLER